MHVAVCQSTTISSNMPFNLHVLRDDLKMLPRKTLLSILQSLDTVFVNAIQSTSLFFLSVIYSNKTFSCAQYPVIYIIVCFSMFVLCMITCGSSFPILLEQCSIKCVPLPSFDKLIMQYLHPIHLRTINKKKSRRNIFIVKTYLPHTYTQRFIHTDSTQTGLGGLLHFSYISHRFQNIDRGNRDIPPPTSFP